MTEQRPSARAAGRAPDEPSRQWWSGRRHLPGIYRGRSRHTERRRHRRPAGVTRHRMPPRVAGRRRHLAEPSPVSPDSKDWGQRTCADYCDVDPALGTLADFDELVAKPRPSGASGVLMDLVPTRQRPAPVVSASALPATPPTATGTSGPTGIPTLATATAPPPETASGRAPPGAARPGAFDAGDRITPVVPAARPRATGPQLVDYPDLVESLAGSQRPRSSTAAAPPASAAASATRSSRTGSCSDNPAGSTLLGSTHGARAGERRAAEASHDVHRRRAAERGRDLRDSLPRHASSAETSRRQPGAAAACFYGRAT